jgi:peptide/nickel transport system permease protein
MYGGRISMSVAIGSVLLGGFVGTALGLVSGYVGGVIDNLLMRLMDALLAFPSLVVAIVLVTALKASLQNVIIAIAITAIPTYARLMRGQVLVTKEREYIEAARALGLGELRIMARHVTPNSVQIVIIQASINAAGAILTEASLSFLGFGVPPPTPTWGGLLHDSYPLLQVAPWIAIVAGAAISVASLSFTFIGNAVRDLLDPKARIF